MLSRVADSLYWMSRYIERAENDARILDVNLQLLLDLGGEAEAMQHWAPVIASLEETELFDSLYDKADERSVIEFLSLRKKNPNSILSCLTLARENARTTREQISSEMWEQINRLYLFVQSEDAEKLLRASPHEFFKRVVTGSHLFQGTTNATMTHGEGWDFIRIGALLERADYTSRILDVKYHILLPRVEDVGGALDYYQWAALLRSVSAFETYRTLYRDQIFPIKVAELLLLERRMPRSLAACFDQVTEALNRIDGQNDQAAKRLASELHARLTHADIEEIFQGGLHEYLESCLDDIGELGSRIQRAYLGTI